MLLTHRSPQGRLHIPTAGVIAPGVEFEVPDEVGASLLAQSEVFTQVAPTRKKGSES